MSKPYDAATKRILEIRPMDWVRLLGLPEGDVSLVDADLSTVTAFSDKLIRVDADTGSYLVHNELESGKDTAGVAERLYHYGALAHHKFGLPVVGNVFLMHKESNSPRLTGRFVLRSPVGKPYLLFRYTVIRVWQLDVRTVLAGGLATLPLAPISSVKKADVQETFNAVRRRVEAEANSDREVSDLLTATGVLMGLCYDRPFIQHIMRGVTNMEESVYWDIMRDKIKEKMRTEIGEEVRAEIGEEVKVEGERDAVVRVGARRFGAVPPAVQERLAQISSLSTLQAMLDKVLDVASWDELLQTA